MNIFCLWGFLLGEASGELLLGGQSISSHKGGEPGQLGDGLHAAGNSMGLGQRALLLLTQASRGVRIPPAGKYRLVTPWPLEEEHVGDIWASLFMLACGYQGLTSTGTGLHLQVLPVHQGEGHQRRVAVCE